MITALSTNASTPVTHRPRPAARETEQPAPTDGVTLSKTPGRSWLGRGLARTAAFLALGTALTLGSLATPAQAQTFVAPPVQTSSSIGLQVDGRGRIGVFLGSQTYNPYSGTVQSSGIGIGPNGVSVQVQTGVPVAPVVVVPPPVVVLPRVVVPHCPPPVVMPLPLPARRYHPVPMPYYPQQQHYHQHHHGWR